MIKNKKTYQRLKDENLKLLNDIRLIIEHPYSLQAIEVKMMYGFKFNQEVVQWYGNSSHKLEDNGKED